MPFLDHAPEFRGRVPDYLAEWARNRLLSGDVEDLDQKAINALTRACIHAGPGNILSIVDYSAIEARVLAWLAGDEPALDLFRSGGDPYKRLGAKIFGVPEAQIPKGGDKRDLAKRAELGCGYGMGAEKFYLTSQNPKMGKVVNWSVIDPLAGVEAAAAYLQGPEAAAALWWLATVVTAADFPRAFGVPHPSAELLREIWKDPDPIGQFSAWLEYAPAVPTTELPAVFALYKAKAAAANVVAVWRDAHPAIVDFWHALDAAAKAACAGEIRTVGPTRWEKRGNAVWCWLPSGRPMIYHGARVSADLETGRPSLSYYTARGRQHLYGGKLAENVTQAVARDVMAAAMVRIEHAGMPIVLTVHDEIVCEIPEDLGKDGLAFQESAMRELPHWAPGLPVDVEGFLATRYRK